MKSLSVEEQIAALRPSVASGFAEHMHLWFLAGATLCLIVAIIFWHPVPLMIAVFLSVIGIAEQRAGPNIVAAIAAYDAGTPTIGEVSITVTCWSDDNHYYAIVHEQGQSDWQYEFVPQGWQPSPSDYAARIWRTGAEGRPVLAVVQEGILIPRYDPKQVDKRGGRTEPA